MRVLVVGGTRYLGRAVVERLAARGDEVTVANRGRTAWELPTGVARIICDITEPGSLLDAIEGNVFDAAVHMVAMDAGRARSVIEDLTGRIAHYVHCGSVGIYLPLSYVPGDEEHPVDPRDDEHGGFNGKCAAAHETEALCAERELPLTIVNPTCVIGPGAVPIDIWGSRDPKLFQRILDGKRITVVNDGRGLVHLGDVRDIADCFVLALDQPAKTGVYNAGSRYGITHDYYVQVLADAMGVEAKVRHMPTEKIIKRWKNKVNVRGIRIFEEHMCFTMGKAERELGYAPKMTPEMSIEENVKWLFDEGIIARK